MEPITDKQVGMISIHILRSIENKLDQHKEEKILKNGSKMVVNKTLLVAEEWIKKNVDKYTAMTVINDWLQNKEELVINQLKHLGLNIK